MKHMRQGLLILVLIALNMLSTRSFGEAGYWFSGVKVITCLIFLFVGLLFILGVGGQSPGVANWTVGEAPFVGGLGGFFSVLMIAGFSFQGAELVGITAGESENPDTSIPKAIKQFFLEDFTALLAFYCHIQMKTCLKLPMMHQLIK